MTDDSPRYDLTRDQLEAALPAAAAAGRLQQFNQLDDAMHEGNINTPHRAAAFLAQLGHASGDLADVLAFIPEALRAQCTLALALDPNDTSRSDKDQYRMAVWYWNLRGASFLADIGEFQLISVRLAMSHDYEGREERVQRWRTAKAAVLPT